VKNVCFSFFGGCSSTNSKNIADYGSRVSMANSDLSTRYYIIEVSWFLYRVNTVANVKLHTYGRFS